MVLARKIWRKRTIKKMLIMNLIVIVVVLFFIICIDVEKSISSGSFIGSAFLLGTLKTSTPNFSYDSLVDYVNLFNPNVSVPVSLIFTEKDTTKNAKEDSLGHYNKRGENIGCGTNDIKKWFRASYKYLSESYLIVNDNAKERISHAHTGIIDSLKQGQGVSYPGSEFYKGNGIVIVGGGVHSLMAYSVIQIIRKSGTTLPIEVLIPEIKISDADIPFCEIIEEHNAKCIYLKNYFSDRIINSNPFKGFQYKSIALLISSFENVLMLDADDYPLLNINDIFDSPAFADNGMVIWPDLWRRTTHPFFYESANITINFNKRIRNFADSFTDMSSKITENVDIKSELPYHDFQGTLPDPSSETGQFMVNKKTHWKSLLLSFYYNSFGPSTYYHLMSQYSAGQGDKETFIAAAHILELPYYQVLSSITMDGYQKKDGSGFESSGYYQKNFIKDYEIKQEILKSDTLANDNDPNYSSVLFRDKYFSSQVTERDAMFAHCNFPKFNPMEMTYNKQFVYKGEHFRGLTHKQSLESMDLEREIYSTYYEILCVNAENPLKQMISFYKGVTQDEVCKYLQEKVKFLETPM
ncbi:hypothetical protein QEN19_004160 [Hanseniaspora menglaensis]